jgi:hypothetical protein
MPNLVEIVTEMWKCTENKQTGLYFDELGPVHPAEVVMQ